MISASRFSTTLFTSTSTTQVKRILQSARLSTGRHLCYSSKSLQSQHHLQDQNSSSAAKMTNYNINITSDIICPWCYIGHTRLNKAIANHKATYPNDTFTLRYRPFYVAPPDSLTTNTNKPPTGASFPVESRPRKEYYAARFGAARAEQIFTMMGATSAKEGLSFKFGGQIGPSRNGHRLVHFAQTRGVKDSGNNGSKITNGTKTDETAQNNVMLGLWRRYFEQEIDITQLDVLVDVGVEAGLNATADEIREYLVSGADADVVDKLAYEASMEGISGVPFYVVQDQWVVEGAQEPRAFEALFGKWKEVEKKQGQQASSASASGVAPGESC